MAESAPTLGKVFVATTVRLTFIVSALMFDYILTGPISGVSAGLYQAGLLQDGAQYFHHRVAYPPMTLRRIRTPTRPLAAPASELYIERNSIICVCKLVGDSYEELYFSLVAIAQFELARVPRTRPT
jgi:hypothetical protein